MCFTFQLIPIFCSLFSYCTNSFSIFLCRDFPPKFLADMAEEPRVLRLVRQLADSSWQKRAEAVEELVADGKARMIWMVGTWEKHDSHTHTHVYIYICIIIGKHIYIYTLKFILPKYFGRLCRYDFVWSVLRKPGASQKTHTNLMKTRRYAKKIGDASGLPLVLP